MKCSVQTNALRYFGNKLSFQFVFGTYPQVLTVLQCTSMSLISTVLQEFINNSRMHRTCCLSSSPDWYTHSIHRINDIICHGRQLLITYLYPIILPLYTTLCSLAIWSGQVKPCSLFCYINTAWTSVVYAAKFFQARSIVILSTVH